MLDDDSAGGVVKIPEDIEALSASVMLILPGCFPDWISSTSEAR
jgi:hypothetical protein